jgi:hypothetical protein
MITFLNSSEETLKFVFSFKKKKKKTKNWKLVCNKPAASRIAQLDFKSKHNFKASLRVFHNPILADAKIQRPVAYQ